MPEDPISIVEHKNEYIRQAILLLSELNGAISWFIDTLDKANDLLTSAEVLKYTDPKLDGVGAIDRYCYYYKQVYLIRDLLVTELIRLNESGLNTLKNYQKDISYKALSYKLFNLQQLINTLSYRSSKLFDDVDLVIRKDDESSHKDDEKNVEVYKDYYARIIDHYCENVAKFIKMENESNGTDR